MGRGPADMGRASLQWRCGAERGEGSALLRGPREGYACDVLLKVWRRRHGTHTHAPLRQRRSWRQVVKTPRANWSASSYQDETDLHTRTHTSCTPSTCASSPSAPERERERARICCLLFPFTKDVRLGSLLRHIPSDATAPRPPLGSTTLYTYLAVSPFALAITEKNARQAFPGTRLQARLRVEARRSRSRSRSGPLLRSETPYQTPEPPAGATECARSARHAADLRGNLGEAALHNSHCLFGPPPLRHAFAGAAPLAPRAAAPSPLLHGVARTRGRTAAATTRAAASRLETRPRHARNDEFVIAMTLCLSSSPRARGRGRQVDEEWVWGQRDQNRGRRRRSAASGRMKRGQTVKPERSAAPRNEPCA